VSRQGVTLVYIGRTAIGPIRLLLQFSTKTIGIDYAADRHFHYGIVAGAVSRWIQKANFFACEGRGGPRRMR
jgi:hypothetical protein